MPVHCQAWTRLSIVKLECTLPAKRFLTEIIFYSITDLYFNQEPIRLWTKIQLKNEANMETLQPTKQNDIVAINNT